MQRTAQGALVLGAGLPALEGCSRSQTPELQTARADLALPRFEFTPLQRSALSAAVAQLIPASGPDDWSAADAGAIEYIEQLLNALSDGGNPKIYAHGPQRSRYAEFEPLPLAKLSGWHAETLRLRTLYAEGADELNRLARGPLALLQGDFSALPAPAQIGILELLDLENTPFFQTLFNHTMEGVYGHPVYGGNRDYIAWNEFCYEGDVHGVRYPNGHDPAATDRPWDQFGGYTPEEIAQPGGSCSTTGGKT